ncbi:MAG: glycosyltransferase family 39 protein [Polyangiaceae bacterium]|nr:glycosyltransferase family 39 protein [Polyangiaceae bacterium]
MLVGFAVFLPSLRTPFLLDDYLHASMLEGTYPVERGPFDLYDFINDHDRPVLVERGMLPWWTHPELKVRFFRPLSSALRWLDHQAFGNAPFPAHLHSFAWWALAVLAVHTLLRRSLAPRAAALASFVFALAPCHTMPLAWLANREALVSLALGSVALVAHLRFREPGGRWRDAALATVLFALALLGGEYAIALGGYVLARELLARGEPLGRRIAGVLPFAVPAAAYLGVRAALGYGTYGSGFYADPFREPLGFLRDVPRRLATLVTEGWLSLDDDTLVSATPGWVVALLALGVVTFLALPLRRTLLALEPERRRALGLLLLGSFLALPPMLATMPAPRLLGASMIGIAAAVGTLLDQVWFPVAGAKEGPRLARELAGLAALGLGFAHLVHGPLTSLFVGERFRRFSAEFRGHADDLRARIGAHEGKQVMVLRAAGASFFLPFALDERGTPPWRWRALSHTGHVLMLARDRRTFDLVVPEDQGLFPSEPGNLFRDWRDPLAPGSVYTVPGVRVTVLEVGRRGPRAARYELDRDWDDPALAWITEGAAGFPEAELPEPGYGKPFDP